MEFNNQTHNNLMKNSDSNMETIKNLFPELYQI